MTSDDLLTAAQAELRKLAGPEAVLRDDQAAAIEALVAGRRRCVVVQRTGWGKSAVYWISTALRRGEGYGPTLVVSPLLALMRDQVNAAQRAGIHAVTLNSANFDEWSTIEAEIAADRADVLLISPERLNSAGFRSRVLPRLAPRLGMLVVDEAHCISDWGHDFRPDYRRIRQVLAGLPAETPVLATTATANSRVIDDIASQLGEETLTLRGTLDRASLTLSVVDTPNVPTAYAWIADALHKMPGSGIVYTLTVAETERLAAFLGQQGHRAEAYSGRTDPEVRGALEKALLANDLKALVATSSLGMGLDKPDLAFVVHLGAPSSPIAYYQQVGRAGRALDQATAVLLPTTADANIWAYFDSTAFPAERTVRRVLDILSTSDGPVTVTELENRGELARGRLESLLKVLDVDGAVERAEGGWIATGQEWVYDRERYEAIAAARKAEQAVMRDYMSGATCLMRALRESLDDPEVTDCGRCSVCTGRQPAPPAREETVDAAVDFLRSQIITIEPRKRWPSGASRRGSIPADLRPEVGRALALGEDPAWGDAITAALDADQPVSQEVLDGVVRVLSRWGWPEGRPTWVTWIPSRRRPRLLPDLAERVAQLGRMQLVEALQPHAGSAPWQSDAPSQGAAGVAALRRWSAMTPVQSGPVLLLDDECRSRWTITVCAALLREAGAGPVYPLVLHKLI
ncbi:RecQ family ATP-dependent DNA helicase [Fodinicola acaciae]|uniref:RecQ family ATP-dependent DNA helicase n=1 Tax=Fodinicola acaciae TaxID=2681555 RepID=UPI0013D8A4F3|nr:RecQ family ATP-dependent DNA helicase [Fodinicola acaciae]